MSEYNGHKNWTHWNVSLWLNNEEWMYRLLMDVARTVKEMIREGKRAPLKRGAIRLQCALPSKTPDGAKYSLVALQAAIKDAMEEL